MMKQSIQQQSLEFAQSAYGGAWLAIGISEKEHHSSWGHHGRCFLVALRKPEHAHFPFPGPLPEGMEDIPNRAVCVFWQGQHYCTLESRQLFEFSQDTNKPTINQVMQQFRKAVESSQSPSRTFGGQATNG